MHAVRLRQLPLTLDACLDSGYEIEYVADGWVLLHKQHQWIMLEIA